MARLTLEQINAEVINLGYELIDATGYVNMNSRIVIKCSKGHIIETCMADLRKPSFTCPGCDKDISFVNPKVVPAKGNKYRVIAFDQATENFGLSIFDNGELVFYNLYRFSGSLTARLVKIQKLLEEVVLTY